MNTTTAARVPAKEPLGARRILLLVFGGITVLVSLALLASGGAALWALSQRDNGGFFMSTHELSTNSYALASESLDVGPEIPGWLEDGLATVHVEVTSVKPVFIGIGPVADVERYLADVEHAQITDFDIDPFSVTYRALDGTTQPEAPSSQNFWRAQATGPGRQTITWPIEEGTWSVVAMNADGSRNVSVDTRLGTRVDYLGWIVIGLLGTGVLVLVAGASLIYTGARRPRHRLEQDVPSEAREWLAR
jgi:hypothetical protein